MLVFFECLILFRLGLVIQGGKHQLIFFPFVTVPPKYFSGAEIVLNGMEILNSR